MSLTPHDFGKLCELRARDILSGSTLVEHYNHPWDLDWMGLRVEVKGRRKGDEVTSLFINEFDALLFFADEIKKVFFIPQSELEKNNHIRNRTHLSKRYSHREVKEFGETIYGKT